MSLINKLLQDLEQRQAGDTHSAAIPAGVQSVFRARRRAAWLVPAMMLLPLLAAGLLWAMMSSGSLPLTGAERMAAKPATATAPATTAAKVDVAQVAKVEAAKVDVAQVAKVEAAKVDVAQVAKVEAVKVEASKVEVAKAPDPVVTSVAVAKPADPVAVAKVAAPAAQVKAAMAPVQVSKVSKPVAKPAAKPVAPKAVAAKSADPVVLAKSTVVAAAAPQPVAARQAPKADTPPDPKPALTEANVAGLYPGIVKKPVQEPTAVAAMQPQHTLGGPSVAKPTVPPEAKSQKTFTLRQQSDNLFKQAVLHAQQGQAKEARELLVKSLEAVPRNAAARQMLVSLLVEANRLPDALSVSREGVKITPDHSGMWVSFARLQLEYGDATGATATLEEGLPSAGNDPSYQAFYAALQQRAGRHDLALKHYLAALASDPGMPNWLVGAGISMQALGRDMDAAEAFQRAKDGGQLPPAFTAFVDQRLSTLKR